MAIALTVLLWAVVLTRSSRSLSTWRLAVFGLACLLLLGGLLGAETVADPSSNQRIHTYDWRYLRLAALGFFVATVVVASAAMSGRAAGARFARGRPRALDWVVVVLLPVGGVVFGPGWCLIMLLLWTSCAWSHREKLVATLALPGGPLVAVVIYAAVASSGWPSAAAVFLARRLRARERASSGWRRRFATSG